MMKKGIAPLAIAAIVAIAVIAVAGVAATTMLPRPYCTDEPTSWRCICPAGQEKYRTTPFADATYACRRIVPEAEYSFPMSAEDDGFKEKMLAYAKDAMREQCPDCSNIDCPSGYIEYGFRTNEPRGEETHGTVECIEQVSDRGSTVWWHVTFSLEDGSMHPVIESYCADSLLPTRCNMR